MRLNPSVKSGLAQSALILAIGLSSVTFAANPGDIVFTEVMYAPNPSQTLWEWVEIKNTTGAQIDLDGWVFDDRGDNTMAASNISSSGGNNTVVPAGGSAVLYNGTALGFDTSRFTNAWGSGINLIGVSTASAATGIAGGLANTDQIGLWSDYSVYAAEDLGTTSGQRRTFNNTITTIDFFTTGHGYPSATGGKSMAWKGTGVVTNPAEWVASVNGQFGAEVSVATTRSTPLNSADDRGNPGSVPAGGRASGLLISEVMYNPRSANPTEAAWEWVEVYNNTGSPIDFANPAPGKAYFFDDDDDNPLAAPNITSGSIANGATAVLFNAAANSLTNMQAVWGNSINFIPVTTWTDLTNGGDMVAIWDSATSYTNDALPGTQSPRRTAASALVALTYDDGEGTMPMWVESDGDSAIELTDLSISYLDSTYPSYWDLSSGGISPQVIFDVLPDHAGGDVGSPGFVPGSVVVGQPGDFNDDGIVDAEDYTVWRDNLDGNSSALNGNGSGAATVVQADYDLWKANFGEGTPGSGGIAGGTVPEPTSAVLMLVALAGLAIGRRSAC